MCLCIYAMPILVPLYGYREWKDNTVRGVEKLPSVKSPVDTMAWFPLYGRKQLLFLEQQQSLYYDDLRNEVTIQISNTSGPSFKRLSNLDRLSDVQPQYHIPMNGASSWHAGCRSSFPGSNPNHEKIRRLSVVTRECRL